MNNITCIGSCAACQRHSVLNEGLCKKCHVTYKDWGPGGWRPMYADILRRCRTDKAFAFMLYSRMSNAAAKDQFEGLVGPIVKI